MHQINGLGLKSEHAVGINHHFDQGTEYTALRTE